MSNTEDPAAAAPSKALPDTPKHSIPNYHPPTAPKFSIIPALQEQERQVQAEPEIFITANGISPTRTSDGDLMLLCPTAAVLKKGCYTPISSEAVVTAPTGWRVYVSTPLQLAASNVFFAAVIVSPTSAGVLSFNLFNANPTDIRLERGAPLALLTPVIFTRITASVKPPPATPGK